MAMIKMKDLIFTLGN